MKSLNAPLTYAQRVSPGRVDVQGSNFPSLTSQGRSFHADSVDIVAVVGKRLPTTGIKHGWYETGT